MRLVNCEHPKLIYSKHLDTYIRVACGKCATCCNTRAKKWINRLDQESQNHKYTYMVTLTYDDAHLPSMFFSDDMEYLVSNRQSIERIPLHDVIDACKDEFGEYYEDDLEYLRSRLIHPLGLPIICPKDISNFFKRFNKYCFKYVTQHYENIRYFAAWEYGPTTYRPHIHLLAWFDDDRISSRFDEILSKTWTFGFTDASAVFSSGGRSYVAQYINRPTHLPSFYSLSAFRQKAQFSKRPSIGSVPLLDSEIRRIYDDLPTKRTIWSSSLSRYVDVPLDPSIKNRLFPKCPEYYRRSHFDRVTLYGSAKIIPASTFREFRSSLDLCRWLTFRNIATDDERDLSIFISSLQRDAKNEKSFNTSLYRFYALSKRVCRYARLMGVTLDAYVSKIEEFWRRVDYDNLKCQLQFQQDYVNNHHSVSDLVHLYPDLCKYIENVMSSPTFVPLYLRKQLVSFGIDDSSDYVTLDKTHDYISMSCLHNKIYSESHKRIHSNIYRDFKLEHDDPTLARIVRKYQTNKHVDLYGKP